MMAGPWEKYAATPAPDNQSGPWQKYATITGAPAKANTTPQVDDPGAFSAGLISAGHTVDQVLDGLTQWWLQSRGEDSAAKALDATNKSKQAAFKPLQEQHPTATALGSTVPSMIIPAGGGATLASTIARLGAAGAIPGALEYGTPEERAKRAATGAVASALGGTLIPKATSLVWDGAKAVSRTAKAFAEPLYDAGRQAIAGRTLVNAAGDAAPQVAARLGQAGELVPGSVPTAAQVAENGGIAGLERTVAAANPAAFSERAMEQASARNMALRKIAGDDVSRAAAEKARTSATSDLYKQADSATYPIDSRLESLLQRPAMQQALQRARTLAANSGRTFSFEVTPANPFSGVGVATNKSKQITGQGLQDLKMAMDEMLSDQASGFTGKAGDAVRALRGQLLNWMEDANPVYRTARTTYADLSKSINQMDIGQKLLQQLEGSLADHGALTKETASKYTTALRNADEMARSATGFKGAGLKDTMTPDQMDTLTAIAQDLARKANAQDLGRGTGSDTFQKLAMSNIANQSGAPRLVSGLLSLPGVSKAAQMLTSGPNQEIQSLIAKALLDPNYAATLMRSIPAKPAPRSVLDSLFANPSRPAQLLGGATGLSFSDLSSQ
ncbi:MAG: hypothetical protein QM749_19755 [Aquabacterium sp.]